MGKDQRMAMLFKEHHRHLSEIKQKGRELTQRTVGIMGLATGWIVLAENQPSLKLKSVLILALVIIAGISLWTIFYFIKIYRIESRVIRKINKYFGFFDVGMYIEKDTIYPEKWKEFGNESVGIAILRHIISIAVMTIVAIVAIWLRVKG